MRLQSNAVETMGVTRQVAATAARLAGLGLAVMLGACSPSRLVDVAPPSNIADPSLVSTPSGAQKLWGSAIQKFYEAYDGDFTARNFILYAGAFTDELMATGSSFSHYNYVAGLSTVDLRTPTSAGNLYINIQASRVALQAARQGLQLYAPGTQAQQGQLFALEGINVLWFAELYCSGIPLTSNPLVGSPVPTRGFSTDELFQHAVTLLDSGVTVGQDSAPIKYLASVGKGRALLGLGKFAEAAAAVHDVPTDFVYLTTQGLIDPNGTRIFGGANWLGITAETMQTVDHEGGTGLVWSADPRAAISTDPAKSGAMRFSGKYTVTNGVLTPTASTPLTPVRVADGVEARLIEAEADLANHGNAWLGILNMLRATCVGSATCAPVPGLTTANLPDTLTDPGTDSARVDLLMRERAMWLFLTGHRQGDLRRMVRVYHRDPTTIYPQGVYHNAGFPPLVPAASFNGTASYFPTYVLQPDPSEAARNTLYSGCNDLNP